MTTTEKAKPQVAAVISLILLALFLLLFVLLPGMVTLLLSFNKYSPAQGLFRSPWVGIENYKRLFQSVSFLPTIGNSFVQSLLGGILPLIPAALAGFAISKVSSKPLAWGFSAILLLPAFVPDLSYVTLVSRISPESFQNPSAFPFLYLFACGIKVFAFGGFLAAAGGLLASEKGRSSLSGVLGGLGTAGVMGLMNLFNPDAGLSLALSNPAIYQTAENMNTATYRSSLMNMEFGAGSANWIIRILLQLIPVVLACFLGVILKKQTAKLSTPDRPSSVGMVLSIFFALIALAATIIAAASGFGANSAAGIPTTASPLAGLMPSLLAALAGTVLLLLFGYGMTSSYGIVAFIMVGFAFLLSQNTVGSYLLIRILGLVRTNLSVILRGMFSPALLLALAFLCFQGGNERPSLGEYGK